LPGTGKWEKDGFLVLKNPLFWVELVPKQGLKPGKSAAYGQNSLFFERSNPLPVEPDF